jgi:glycosyltransferase involved in cell wall biosynthesis
MREWRPGCRRSREDAIRALFLFPHPTFRTSRQAILDQWKRQRGPDTLLCGMNHLERFGVQCGFLEARFNGRWGDVVERADHLIRNNIAQQLRAAAVANAYDIVICKDLPTSLILLALKRFGVVRTPVVLFDPVITDTTPLPSLLGWALRGADRIAYCATSVRDILTRRFGLGDRKLTFMPFSVDMEFFRPQGGGGGRAIVSVGSNDRDYEVLIEAARELGAPLCITTSKRPKEWVRPGVEVLQGIDYLQLRAMYARSALVAVPLVNVPGPSGVIAVLEAMAMAKAVVVTRSRGLEDYIVDGQNALYARAGDAGELKERLSEVIRDQDLRRRLGDNGRRSVEETFNTSKLAARLAEVIADVVGAQRTSGRARR